MSVVPVQGRQYNKGMSPEVRVHGYPRAEITVGVPLWSGNTECSQLGELQLEAERGCHMLIFMAYAIQHFDFDFH